MSEAPPSSAVSEPPVSEPPVSQPPVSQPPAVTIIIVAYHSAETLGATLASVFGQQCVAFEVLLVDNEPGAPAHALAAPWLAGAESGGRLRFFASPANRGFGGANNDAARLARAPLLLLLNPDIVLPTPTTLATLLAAVQAEQAERGAGLWGFKTLAADGQTLLHCGGVVDLPAHTHMLGRGEADTGQYDRPADVDFVEGSCLCLPLSVWRRLGGFREIYWPAYYEDTDLCVRARRAGLPVRYLPVAVIHREKTREETNSPNFWIMFQAARVLFTVLNFGGWALLTRAAPAEWLWFWQPGMRWQRRPTLRAYRRVAGRLLRAMLGRAPGPPAVDLAAHEMRD